MKKILNIFIIFIIFIVFLNTFNINTSMANVDVDKYKPSEFTEDKSVTNIAKTIIGGFQAIGSIASVLAIIFIGTKYLLGSVEEKAEYKNTAMRYIIGAILVFAISNISSMLYNFAISLNKY